jgi:type IV pilus assembly protein PilF
LQAALSSKASADMLWLAIQIERALGDANLEASYALELRQNYPESEQAQLLQGMRP